MEFNEELRYQIRLGGVMEREIQLDVTALGKTLEEIERDYLD